MITTKKKGLTLHKNLKAPRKSPPPIQTQTRKSLSKSKSRGKKASP